MARHRSRDPHTHPHGPSQRQLRAGELVRAILSGLLLRGAVDDEALAGRSVTVSEVRLSPDLKHATVFVTDLGGGHTADVVAALNRARRYLRGQLGRELTMKFTPDLSFRADESFDEARRVDRLLNTPAVARDLGAPPEDE